MAEEERISSDLALGHHHEVIGELESLTTADPLRERLWGMLMLALYRSGRQADALAAYARARDLLSEQLGIDPSRGLQRLHARILAQDPGPSVASGHAAAASWPGDGRRSAGRGAHRRLQDPRRARPRRHECGLPRRARDPAPEGGAQAPRAAALVGRAVPRPVRARVPARREPRPPERDPDLRGGRGRGVPVHRDALRGRDRPAEGDTRERRPIHRANALDHAAARGGARRGASARAGSPRREARQHPDRTDRYGRRDRAGLPLGLRAHETRVVAVGRHRHGAVHRHARLRGTRAVPGAAARCAHGRLLARGGAVRMPDRTPAVPP